MAEDFNNNLIVVEDKQSILCDNDKCSLCGEINHLIECGDCGRRFCNEMIENKSHIMLHLLDSDHKTLKIIANPNFPNKYEKLKCSKCDNDNIFDLFIMRNPHEENSFDMRKYVFCKEHSPKNCDPVIFNEKKESKANESIIIEKEEEKPKSKIRKVDKQKIIERQMLLKEFEEFNTRKLNKVKKTYKTKYEYYEIYKPLIIADYLYTKQVYENKDEYDIDLLVNKKEKYYFQIEEDFTDINFFPGKVLKFIEVDKYEYYKEDELYELENEEYEPIIFVGVITNLTYSDNKLYNIWIMPINKHITSLKGHQGLFKMKEALSTIPYMRMLESLDLFQNDEIGEGNEGAVSANLTRRILGHFPTQYQKGNKKNLENYEDYQKKEKNELNKLFGENITSKIETSIEKYGKLNDSQVISLRNVFSNILNLIQGPPGTGKTFLSSFIAYNIFKYRRDKYKKILICSPSNAATDNLSFSLLKINKSIGKKMKICRVYAKTREFVPIENELLNISLHKKLQEKFDTDDLYFIPKDELQDKINEIIEETDIVICTCSTSWDERIMSNNFPFVIIDEVTQCCELESLIPIVHGCKHLTLVGDPKQLGPIILHPKADSTGMKVSLFERMLALYPELHNFLSIQYRMHEEIVKFPNKEFYENKIENGFPPGKLTNKEFNSKFKWPNEKIPLIFVDVNGKEIMTKSRKSKQNEDEAKIVTLFVEKLINLNIDFNKIGIITPYTAQKVLILKKLREKFKEEDLIQNLKISSVDGFQGGEKDFIILSNVRSNLEGIIGFLSDFRRLNVSITRARYGMIVIGNANCLMERSAIWGNFVDYYYRNGLLVEPTSKVIIENGKKNIEYDINNFEKGKIEEENLKERKINYQEYDFDDIDYEAGINQDYLDNFECSENVYGEGNKKYYKKKKEKRDKKNKKKNKTKKQFYY